jgi:D-alanine-D-alanine ligase
LGVGFVDRAGDLPAAVMAALSFSGAAIIEAKIEGSELALAAVGTPADPLPLVEIVPKSGVYDYAARYTAGATEYFSPARLSTDVTAAATQAALAAVGALRLRDLTRVDLMVGTDGLPWILEVNVSPGMTETSLVPMAARAAGMALPQVCDRVLQSALQRLSGEKAGH